MLRLQTFMQVYTTMLISVTNHIHIVVTMHASGNMHIRISKVIWNYQFWSRRQSNWICTSIVVTYRFQLKLVHLMRHLSLHFWRFKFILCTSYLAMLQCYIYPTHLSCAGHELAAQYNKRCFTTMANRNPWTMALNITIRWRRGAVGRVSDLRSSGRGFESRPGTRRRNFGQVFHTYVPLFTKQYKLVPAKGRWCLAAGE